MNSFTRISLVAVMAVLTIPVAHAEEQIGPNRYAMTLKNVNVRPGSAEEARKTLSRIEGAAISLCGAPHGSSSILKRAVMKSDCFKNSVAEAVRKIDNPLINRLHDSLH